MALIWISWPMKRPTMAPMRPRQKVATSPMAWRPGITRRPRAPMTRPTTMALMMADRARPAPRGRTTAMRARITIPAYRGAPAVAPAGGASGCGEPGTLSTTAPGHGRVLTAGRAHLLTGLPPALLGQREVPAPLGHPRQSQQGPPAEQALAQILGDPQGRLEGGLGLVQAAKLLQRHASGAQGVGVLPA